jgi:putative oxidoreductase
MKIGTLALRVTIGGFFVGHGSQKLFGAQGGPGLKATGHHFEKTFGIKPGLAQAAVAGAAETGGGLGLLLGYHTPLAASAVVGSMITAVQKVHGKNGWNVQNGGFEYNALIIAGAFTIAESGPGFLSLDALRGQQRKGIIWGLFALGAGAGGAFASHAVSNYFGGGSPLAEAVVEAAENVTEAVTESAHNVSDAVAESAQTVADAVPAEGSKPISAQASIEDALTEVPGQPTVAEPVPVKSPVDPESPEGPLKPGI